ncbi:MAG: hypothetical protein JXA41_04295 [Deltaproteobacteria bacterium]|nr:hypothetical protein [Deltaproteobacteria bacterium]
MRKIAAAIIFLLTILCQGTPGVANPKCVDANGEAAIMNDDIPSATLEATARAKWAAVEQVVGAEIKTQTFVQDFTLVDEVIKQQVGGVVKSYKILKQEKTDDTIVIHLNACVEPKKAQQAVSSMALNNAVAVFIPARRPDTQRGIDEYDETNILSETLIGKLAEQNYTVIDVAPTHVIDAQTIEKAVKTGSTLAVRSMMYKFLSNIMIIGKTDYSIAVKKGEDIGYNLNMPFNSVTVRLTYRIVAKNNESGNIEILCAGTEQAKGLSGSVEDAAQKALKNLAEAVSPVLLDKIGRYIQGNTKKISIKVANVTNIDVNMEIKEILQHIIWVSGVEEERMGEFVVAYPENTLYLANSIRQKGSFKIVDFSTYSITLTYEE